MDRSNASNADDFIHGFRRPEMYSSALSGTVDSYDRHVFICYKTHKNWPEKIEDYQIDTIPRVLDETLKSRKTQISGKIRLTLCEGDIGGESCDGDVLIFPDMIRYRGLTHVDVDGFVDDVLVRCSKWAPKVPETLTGLYIFVCSHKNRDKRCGQCGPILVENFNKETNLRGMKNKVFVSPCSHLGGHQYAGNLIIFGPGLQGKCEGHWYGYVTPNDVPRLLDDHIGKGKIVEQLWRGQMSSVNYTEKKLKEKNPQGSNDGNVNRALCCCSNDPSNCCANKSIEEITGKGELSKKNTRQGPITKGYGRL